MPTSSLSWSELVAPFATTALESPLMMVVTLSVLPEGSTCRERRRMTVRPYDAGRLPDPSAQRARRVTDAAVGWRHPLDSNMPLQSSISDSAAFDPSRMTGCLALAPPWLLGTGAPRQRDIASNIVDLPGAGGRSESSNQSSDRGPAHLIRSGRR